MCSEEDRGVRPIHRSRLWKAKERMKEKERKMTSWHKSQKHQISAPLIIDPTAGTMTKELKEVCRKFESVTGMRVAVQERAGDSVKHMAKPEPLREKAVEERNASPAQQVGGNVRRMGQAIG